VVCEKILITGVSGTIGAALAHHLAPDNEVWGVARFAGTETRDKEAYTAVATPPPASVRRRKASRANRWRSLPHSRTASASGR